MEERTDINVSIPIVGVLDEQKTTAILSKFASSATAERFLQANSIKTSSPLLRQTRRLLKETMGEPVLKQRYINDEYYATVDYGVRNHPPLDVVAMPQKKLVAEKPQVRKPLLQQIYEEDRLEKPEIPKPAMKILREIQQKKDLNNGRISYFLFTSHALSQGASDEQLQSSGYQLQLQQMDVYDEVLMYRIQHSVDAACATSWCIGGLSHYEIVNRFLKRYINVLSQIKPKAPFNEYRAEVVRLTKEINKLKVIAVNELLLDNQYLLFPIAFDDVFPKHFAEVLRLYGLEENTTIHQYFKMRVLTKYKDDAQRAEVINMAELLQNDLEGAFKVDVDKLIMKIVESDNTPLQSQAGSVIKNYYVESLLKYAPTSVNKSQDYVSCKMDERMQRESTLIDCVRYLEGFCTVFCFKPMQHVQAVSSLVSAEVAELSLAMAKVFEALYVVPLLVVGERMEPALRENYIKTTQSSRAVQIIDSMRDLKASDQGLSVESFFERYAAELEEEQLRRIESQKTLISNVRRCLCRLRSAELRTDIATPAGARDFVCHLIKSKISQQISPQQFRAVRTQYLREHSQERQPSYSMSPTAARFLPYYILAALAAAVKAVEEAHPTIVASKLGEIEERRFKSQMWAICDENGVLLRGLCDVYCGK